VGLPVAFKRKDGLAQPGVRGEYEVSEAIAIDVAGRTALSAFPE
jgi:hypothetical protein